jgi:hypothetical protein
MEQPQSPTTTDSDAAECSAARRALRIARYNGFLDYEALPARDRNSTGTQGDWCDVRAELKLSEERFVLLQLGRDIAPVDEPDVIFCE